MSNVADRATFENAYAGKAPWGIGKPQGPFVAVADQVSSPVLDAGLFHVFSDDDRRRYVHRLAQVLEPGRRLFLMCFSDEEPGIEGPRRVSRQELYDAFADGWEVESIQPVWVEVNPEFTAVKFSEGGPKAWFAVVRRQG
jgi:hypothetical protein